MLSNENDTRGTSIIWSLQMNSIRRIDRFVGWIELPDEKGCRTKDQENTTHKTSSRVWPISFLESFGGSSLLLPSLVSFSIL